MSCEITNGFRYIRLCGIALSVGRHYSIDNRQSVITNISVIISKTTLYRLILRVLNISIYLLIFVGISQMFDIGNTCNTYFGRILQMENPKYH